MLKPDNYRRINQKGYLKRTLIVGVCLGLILITFQGCFSIFGILPWRYEAEPIVGRIIDNETGEPIAGVAVVALWFLADPFEQGGTKRFEVIETVTDEEGLYGIAGWGPRWRPWFYRLTDSDPRLVIFNPGYWPELLFNDGPNESINFNPSDVKIRKAYWHGKDIGLRRFKLGKEIEKQLRKNPNLNPSRGRKFLTLEAWASRISSAQSGIDWLGLLFGGSKEEWLKIKNFVRLIHQECLKLPSNGPSGNLRNRIDRVPEKYHELLLGDLPPCR